MNHKINRKDFIKGLFFFLLLPLFLLIDKMLKDHERFGVQQRKLRIPNAIPNGLSIHDEVIISKSEDTLKIYSSKCTHLGCKINTLENGEIICPCHGSRYNSMGEPIKGPSIRNLQSLTYEIDESKNELIIQLS